MLKLFKIVLICFLLNMQIAFVQAQNASIPFEFTQLSKKLDKIEKNLKSGDHTTDKLEENSTFLADLTNVLQITKKENEKEGHFVISGTGGVGLLTRIALMQNVVESYEKTNQK